MNFIVDRSEITKTANHCLYITAKTIPVRSPTGIVFGTIYVGRRNELEEFAIGSLYSLVSE